MASTVYSGYYGDSVYGVARYGIVSVVHSPDGLQATVTSNSGVNIIGDARHVVVSLVAPVIEGSVGVIGVANVNVTGRSATFAYNPAVSFILDCRFESDSISSAFSYGDVVVVADSNYELIGQSSSFDVGDVFVTASAVPELTGQSSTVVVNDSVSFILDCRFDLTSAGVSVVEIGDIEVAASSLTTDISVNSVSVVLGQSVASADANSYPAGNEIVVSIGTATTVTNNRVPVVGFEVESSVNDAWTIIGYSNYEMVGVETLTVLGIPIIAADSNYAISSGEDITSLLGDPVVANNAIPTFDSLFANMAVDSVSVSTTSFDYNAVADAYARFRTILINPGATSAQRKVIVEQQCRTVAVARASSSSDRAAKVG